ncbi:MAG: FkbM family methyltransferase, partial [Bacteroidota bacterium]
GLSQPIPALSIEYLSFTMDRTLACIDRLMELGPYEFNWTFMESADFQSDKWLSGDQLKHILSQYLPDDPSGDVYARIPAL